MASKVTLIIAVVALVALQGTSGGIIDDINASFGTAITNGINNFKTIQTEIVAKIGNISASARAQASAAIAQMNQTIQGYVAKAEAAGVAVQECTSATNEALKTVGDDVSSGSQACVQSASTAVQPSIDGVQATLQEANASFTAIRQKASACSLFDFTCRVQVGVSAGTEAASLGVKLGSGFAQVQTQVSSALPVLSSCEVNNIRTNVGKVQTQVESTIKCIQDKIDAAGAQ